MQCKSSQCKAKVPKNSVSLTTSFSQSLTDTYLNPLFSFPKIPENSSSTQAASNLLLSPSPSPLLGTNPTSGFPYFATKTTTKWNWLCASKISQSIITLIQNSEETEIVQGFRILLSRQRGEVWILYFLVTQANPQISHFFSKWIYCVPIDSEVAPASFEFKAANTGYLTLGKSCNFLLSQWSY